MGLRWAAFLFGLAEATLFFVVPDVLLTTVAAHDLERGLRLCAWTLGGALLGGACMYAWGGADAPAARAAVLAVPGIDRAMVADVDERLAARGGRALFGGPLQGTPYKVYAVRAAPQGLGLAAFLAVSIPARLARFLLLTLASSAFFRWIVPRWSARARHLLLGFVWVGFYVLYFVAIRPW